MSQMFTENPIIRLYLKKIILDCLEDRIDHLWTQIIRFYFPLNQNYGIERETNIAREDRTRTNVLLTKLHEGVIVKAIFVECKRPETRDSPASGATWTWKEAQLRNYMVAARRLGPIKDLYGIVANGNEVRFYRMIARTKKLDRWSNGLYDQDHVFSTKVRPQEVHAVMQDLCQLLRV